MKFHLSKLSLLICVLLCIGLLASCVKEESATQKSSSSQAEQNTSSHIQKSPEEILKGEAGSNGPAPAPVINEDQTHSVGEDVIYENENGEKMQYKVKSVNAYTNVFDCNVTAEQLPDPSVIDAKGNLPDGTVFIVLDLQVTNINIQNDEQNISSIGLRYCPAFGQESVQVSENFCFFSAEESEREYYHYKLVVGQSKDLKVGWIVDINNFDKSKLYFSIGEGEIFGANTKNNKKYVSLGL